MNITPVKGFTTKAGATNYIARNFAGRKDVSIQLLTGGVYLVVLR